MLLASKKNSYLIFDGVQNTLADSPQGSLAY